MREALEQDSERCAASRRKPVPDAQLGHIMACLQNFGSPLLQKMYMNQSGGRIFVAPADCPRQRLHNGLKNAPCNEENEKQADDTKTDGQTAGYFEMIRAGFGVLLWICESSRQSVCPVHLSWKKELGRVSVVRLVKVPPFLVLVVNEDIFHAGPA